MSTNLTKWNNMLDALFSASTGNDILPLGLHLNQKGQLPLKTNIGYPKWWFGNYPAKEVGEECFGDEPKIVRRWFGKGGSFQVWPFLVSMLNFWGVFFFAPSSCGWREAGSGQFGGMLGPGIPSKNFGRMVRMRVASFFFGKSSETSLKIFSESWQIVMIGPRF